MICDCRRGSRGEDGFTLRSDDVWVHAKCRRPAPLYFATFLRLKEEEMVTHLNLLQLGPLHNTMLTNPELTERSAMLVREDSQQLLEHVHNYRWTSETLTGQSGKVARVWKWKGGADD